MRLLPGEEMITSSGDETLKLTNQRIRLKQSSWGKYYQMEFFLDDISSIESKYKINHIYLLFALIAGLSSFGVTNHMDEFIIPLWVLAGVFTLLWLFSRRHRIQILSSGGSKIIISIKRMSDSTVQDFIYSIQDAKFKSRRKLKSMASQEVVGIAS